MACQWASLVLTKTGNLCSTCFTLTPTCTEIHLERQPRWSLLWASVRLCSVALCYPALGMRYPASLICEPHTKIFTHLTAKETPSSSKNQALWRYQQWFTARAGGRSHTGPVALGDRHRVHPAQPLLVWHSPHPDSGSGRIQPAANQANFKAEDSPALLTHHVSQWPQTTSSP